MQYNRRVEKSFFQTEAWGEFKCRFGWQVDRVQSLLELRRRLPLGRSMRYFPELPYLPEVLQIVQTITTTPKKGGEIYARFEFLEPFSEEKAAELAKLGLVKSFEEVQPEWRQRVNIAGSEEDILTAMKPKGRYNIGVAERSGLAVTSGGAELSKDFFALYAFTSARTGFSGRGLAYFQELIKVLVDNNVGEVILIKKGNDLLAGGVFLYYDGTASYLYGGSMGDRSLMAPYLLHWEAMKRAKARNCHIYDLLAVAPTEASEQHPYAGLTRFKSQFGGQTVQMLGSWDLVQSRFWYTMYRFVETRRRGNL